MKNHPPGIPSYEIKEFAPRQSRYAFVVITWNEGERVKDQLKRMRPKAREADIILADGDSQDGSTEVGFLQEMKVRVLLITKERGLGTAIRMGIDYALKQGYEGIITVDGNGKDGVEAISAFIKALDEGFDHAQGSRFLKGGSHKNTPLQRHLGVKYIMSPIISLACGFWYTDVTNGFRALSRRYLTDPRVLPLRPEFVDFDLQLYLVYRAPKLGMKVKEIPVVRNYPDDGTVPTKITSLSRKIQNVREMFEVALGMRKPSKSQ